MPESPLFKERLSPFRWVKVADPNESHSFGALGLEVENRFIVSADSAFNHLAGELALSGAQVRRVQYLLEQEVVALTDVGDQLSVSLNECHLVRPIPKMFSPTYGNVAKSARDAFDLMWQNHAPLEEVKTEAVPVDEMVPPNWVRYMPYPTLNPAQAEAIPQIRTSDSNLIIVAPTGAGKTVIGMTAVLRTVLEQNRKAAWLVPQRSLTDELNRELDTWRQRGLKVERLSGEHRVDIERVRSADLWVATTEKFESICRATCLREALAEVGCLIVDEIHLLGDPVRGPVLEALLARVRGGDLPMRIVGLSATVANDEQIADWLHAQLLRITWRPTRLTWQLPIVASNPDWGLVEAARTRLASAITRRITSDGGGVLVFCGNKRNVRRTALFIAAGRGARVDIVHPDDLDRLHEVCSEVGVGLHYKGWEHNAEAEKAFRSRDLDVLVATSTVAAGVNLPARAVVVRDTQVGLDSIDVATVQQMFGRAGRTGQGEQEGWAFLIVDEIELPDWQSKLLDGHRVESRIQSSLADHVLAEAVQNRVNSIEQAEKWWVQTLANYQGIRSLEPLHDAIRFLAKSGYIVRRSRDESPTEIVPTDLGTMTSRMMVSTTVGDEIRRVLASASLPNCPDEAEELLVRILATVVPSLAQAPISESLKAVVSRLLASGGYVDRLRSELNDTLPSYVHGDLARVALLTAARSPDDFHSGARSIRGVPYAAMYPILEEAPRYLHWISNQGFLSTVHPWCAIVAHDLGKRIKWRRFQPRRGAGRLLWMCEQMATSIHSDTEVPKLVVAALARGISSPDWTSTGRPSGCQLDMVEYASLLFDRATGVQLELRQNEATLTGTTTTVLSIWSGSEWWSCTSQRGKALIAYPDSHGPIGAAAFTWRGDFRATGWLQEYQEIDFSGAAQPEI